MINRGADRTGNHPAGYFEWIVPNDGLGSAERAAVLAASEILEYKYTYAYTCKVMPNKTIYVKDADLPLLEQAQEQLGESVSSMFAEFLRERVARLSPEESRIIDLINRITTLRETAKRERNLPGFVEGEHAEAQSYAERALKSFRAGEIRKTKALFWAANAYHDRAQRDANEVKELNGRIAEMLGRDDKPAVRGK